MARIRPYIKAVARTAARLLAPAAVPVGYYAYQRGIKYMREAGKRKVNSIIGGVYTPPTRRQRRSPSTPWFGAARSLSPPSPVRGRTRVRSPSVLRPLRRIASSFRTRSARYGAANSKSIGFIKTPMVKKRSVQNKSNTLGTTVVIEKGGVLDAGVNSGTAGNTVAVGHCNYPQDLAHLIFWRAIVKRLLVKMGSEECLNFEANMPFLAVGDAFRVSYRPNTESSNTFTDYNVTGATTPNAIALNFHNFFLGLLTEDGLELQHIYYLPQTPATGTRYIRQMCVVNLYNATFTIFGKSTLKVQNRTVNTATGDEESVDNVPLHGKAYSGYGSGTSAISLDSTYPTAASGFWCEDTTGLMAKVPTEKWYQEVVPPTMFKEVRTHGKVLLDPGHIRTSVLDSKKVFSVSKIYKTLFCTKEPTNHDKTSFGLFRFMILEKMINAVAGTTTNGIKVAYESNLRIGGFIKTRNNNETLQLNSVANLAPTGEA